MSVGTRGIFGPGTEVGKQAAVTGESRKVKTQVESESVKEYGEPG